MDFYSLSTGFAAAAGRAVRGSVLCSQPAGCQYLLILTTGSVDVFVLSLSRLLVYLLALGSGGKILLVRAVAISTAILAKATAAHLGLFFGLLILEKVGFAALTKLRFWGFGAIALIPSVFWYSHAHQFWKQN